MRATVGWSRPTPTGRGFVIGLREAGHELAGRRVLLVGAGRAVAFAVAGAGAAGLTIANRTAARAERLASDVAASYPALTAAVAAAVEPLDPAGHDVVINATSLGMRPGDPLPVAVSRLALGTLVCDIMTRPEQTRLLGETAARGCVPHPGLPMLAGQVDLILEFLGLSGHRPG
jgi:shikimate dehydrogenase